MRTQYHFWPSEGGFDAWDVGRLIELSGGLPTEEVPIKSIDEIDTVYWFDGARPATVRAVVEHAQMINDVDMSHPVILSVEGRVMDGMHRIARALLEGRETVTVVRFRTVIEPDYRNCRPQDLPC